MKAFHEVRNYTDDFRVWNSDYHDISFIAHWHRELELIYIHSGNVCIHVNDETIYAREGDLIFIDAQAFHYCDSLHQNNHLDFIVFDPSVISSRYRNSYFGSALISSKELAHYQLKDIVLSLFSDIRLELSERKPYYEQVVSARLKEFLFLLKRYHTSYAEAGTSQYQKDTTMESFRNFLDYLDEHLSEDITVTIAASKMNFSEGYFTRVFKRLTGMSFISYLNAIRIEQAAEFLLNSDRKISDISLSCGFRTIRSFNRTFKEYTGYTPSQYIRLSDAERSQFSFYRRNKNQAETVLEDSITVIRNQTI